MKAYTDLEQSKKLAEILPLESADMYWWSSGKRYYIEAIDDGDFNENIDIRSWSLAALLDYLSANFHTDIRYLDNYWELDCRVQFAYDKELVDACYEMIIKLHELKML